MSLVLTKIHQLHDMNQLGIQSTPLFWLINSEIRGHHSAALALLIVYSMGRRAKYLTVSERKCAHAAANAQFNSTAQ